MHLSVRLFALLRERAGSERLELGQLPEPLDVAGLKRELERRLPALGPLGFVRGVIGTSYVPDDTPLQEGQEVSLLPPVSGGAPVCRGDRVADLEAYGLVTGRPTRRAGRQPPPHLGRPPGHGETARSRSPCPAAGSGCPSAA